MIACGLCTWCVDWSGSNLKWQLSWQTETLGSRIQESEPLCCRTTTPYLVNLQDFSPLLSGRAALVGWAIFMFGAVILHKGNQLLEGRMNKNKQKLISISYWMWEVLQVKRVIWVYFQNRSGKPQVYHSIQWIQNTKDPDGSSVISLSVKGFGCLLCSKNNDDLL